MIEDVVRMQSLLSYVGYLIKFLDECSTREERDVHDRLSKAFDEIERGLGLRKDDE